MNRPYLRAVDTETGELHDGCPGCQERDDIIDGLERSVGKLERQIRAMARDRDRERMDDPERQLVLSVIDKWKRATGHPRSRPSGDRFDTVKARLREGYTVEQLLLAVEGIGAFPFVVNGQRRPQGTPAQRHDRLGICLGCGEQVERFANLAHRNGSNGHQDLQDVR